VGEFLQELKRRNVFRVGVAYAVVSWLIIQIIETVSEPLGLPDWTEAFFIVLVLAGLPLVLIFAWAFELTPEGLKKTEEVDKEKSVTSVTGRKLNYTIIAVLVVALGYSVWDRQGMVEQNETTTALQETPDEIVRTSAASIAVLPFVNMSADPEQDYFSDGISEELLNLLAKIPDLRVPARTSSFQFKGQNLDIADVAEQLNVKHVLEGSVRRADVRIRVTAQLIEAESGYHLWSETYDRELTDIFLIQDEISAAIVEALSATLGINADAAPHVKAAANPEAYNAFLFGQHLVQKRTKSDIEAAIPNFERAIELDSTYAPAHANLGLAWYLLTASRPTYGTLTLEESLGKALPHIEMALQLDPELADAHGVMGLTLDARQRFEEALPYFAEALRLNPSYIEVRNWYSQTLDALGREEEALEQMETAYEIDPLSVLTLHNYTNELVMRRRHDQVRPVLDRLEQLDPSRGAMFRSFILSAEGKQGEAAEVLFRGADSNPGDLQTRSNAAFALMNFGLEEDALQVWPYPNLLPIVSNGFDDDYALQLAKQQFEDDPTNPSNVESLAWSYWNVGDKEQALKMARRYRDSLGETRAPIDGINRMFALDAWQRGDRDEMVLYLEPLDEDIDRAMASGVDMFFTNYGKAAFEYMKGDVESAYRYLKKAMSIGLVQPSGVAYFYDVFGWNELPEFVALREDHETYRQREKVKFLKIACGPDGFSTWQPAPETCAEIEAI
jgi:TolB-like protein/lipoprotein NlpI